MGKLAEANTHVIAAQRILVENGNNGGSQSWLMPYCAYLLGDIALMGGAFKDAV